MLYIRREQMTAFANEAERRYMKKLSATMPAAWPRMCVVLGDRGIMSWIEKGFAKAKKHGFRDYNDITRFVHLMFQLVDDGFDLNPNLPWAAAILGWKNVADGLRLAALERNARQESEKK